MSKTGGLSSGLDVNSIVAAMMDVEKITLQRMSKTKAMYDRQLNNYQQATSLVNQFSTAVDNLDSAFKSSLMKITSSDETAVSAVVSGNAESTGTHTIEISQLATASQIASKAFSTRDQALGIQGTVEMTTGENSFTLDIDPLDTMENIRDHINYALDNQSATASILATTANDGVTPEFRLILTSQQTGLAQALVLSGDAPGALDLTDELAAASDAMFTFDGFDVVRSTNTISDLLDGLTLTLGSANSNVVLTLAPDTINQAENVKKGISGVVDAYNALVDLIDKNQSTKSLRDGTYSLIKLHLQNTMTQVMGSSAIKSWVDMGVVTAPTTTLVNEDGVDYVSTGKLKIDDDLFAAAMQNNYHGIRDFFTASGGFIATAQAAVTDVTQEGGTISAREGIITQQENVVVHRMEREEDRLDTVKEKLIRQYAALDTFIQLYQQISNFLEQQIESMNHFRSR